MTAEIIDFYPHWREKQERLRVSLGYPKELWYSMRENGYDPLNKKHVKQFLKKLEELDES